MAFCLSCGASIDEYDSAYYARNMLCIPCYSRKASESYVYCEKCGTRLRREEARYHKGRLMCGRCISELERAEREVKCAICKKTVESWQKSMRAPDGRIVHVECAEKSQGRKTRAVCSRCGAETAVFKLTAEGVPICADCVRRQRQKNEGGEGTILHSLLDRIGGMIG